MSPPELIGCASWKSPPHQSPCTMSKACLHVSCSFGRPVVPRSFSPPHQRPARCARGDARSCLGRGLSTPPCSQVLVYEQLLTKTKHAELHLHGVQAMAFLMTPRRRLYTLVTTLFDFIHTGESSRGVDASSSPMETTPPISWLVRAMSSSGCTARSHRSRSHRSTSSLFSSALVMPPHFAMKRFGWKVSASGA